MASLTYELYELQDKKVWPFWPDPFSQVQEGVWHYDETGMHPICSDSS